MEFQDLLRKIRTFLRHTKLVHFLFVTPRNIFRPVRARFFNKPWWPMKLFYHHEKCKVDFSRREHPRNTNRSSFPFLPSSFSFFPFSFLSLYYSFFSSAFHESSRSWKKTRVRVMRVFLRHRLLVKMQNGVENFFRSSHRYLDLDRNVREVRYGNRGSGVSFLVSREIRCRTVFSLKDIRGSDARCQDVISFLFAGSRVSTVFFFHAGFYFRRTYNWM